jgi:hypothetical protein
MRKLLGITLGIMTALGGFEDLGQIVFTTQAGALFGYKLLWTIVLGSVGIILYREMCGRVAVVAGEPLFRGADAYGLPAGPHNADCLKPAEPDYLCSGNRRPGHSGASTHGLPGASRPDRGLRSAGRHHLLV